MVMKFKPWIYDLPKYIPGKTLEEIRKKYNLEVVYKLASNENILGPAPPVIDYIQNNAKDINYYPDSDCRELRKSLSSRYNISADSIIIGNGTDQIIEMVCDCFINGNSNVVISDPTFLIYEKSTLKCGGEVIKVPLKNFRQDVESLVNAINEQTKIIFLTNPHNPTGTNISRDEFEYVIENVDKDILIVVDEAYWEYIPEVERIDAITYLDKNPNLIILRTFSKIYGLAGLRVGYGISSYEVISVLNKIRLPFNVNSIAQKAAVVALENERYIEEVRDEIQKEKKKFYNAFKRMGIEYVNSYSNFILVKIGEKSKNIVEELLKNGFIIRPGEDLGLAGYARITISVPEVNDKFLDIFTKIYSNYYNVIERN